MLIERSREIKWIKMLNNWDKALQTDKVIIVILNFGSISKMLFNVFNILPYCKVIADIADVDFCIFI